MRNATILVINLKGLATEVVKNIVLAGIGKLVLADDGKVAEEDLGAGFFYTDEDVGKSVSAGMLFDRMIHSLLHVVDLIIGTPPILFFVVVRGLKLRRRGFKVLIRLWSWRRISMPTTWVMKAWSLSSRPWTLYVRRIWGKIYWSAVSIPSLFENVSQINFGLLLDSYRRAMQTASGKILCWCKLWDVGVHILRPLHP